MLVNNEHVRIGFCQFIVSKFEEEYKGVPIYKAIQESSTILSLTRRGYRALPSRAIAKIATLLLIPDHTKRDMRQALFVKQGRYDTADALACMLSFSLYLEGTCAASGLDTKVLALDYLVKDRLHDLCRLLPDQSLDKEFYVFLLEALISYSEARTKRTRTTKTRPNLRR